MASLHVARTHAVLMIGTVLLGGGVLWLFFRFVGAPLARFDGYLLANGLIERYSAGWWVRSALMWIVVGTPFFASGWMVAEVASRTPLLPVRTFALSVSRVILITLLLDTGPGDPAPLRMWLTLPLFLMVAPATAIALGGFAAARR